MSCSEKGLALAILHLWFLMKDFERFTIRPGARVCFALLTKFVVNPLCREGGEEGKT